MGVMACNRRACENILCDHYSKEHGYICNECLTELKSKVPNVTVYEFMDSNKISSDDLCFNLMRRAALTYIEQEFTLN